MTRKRIEGTALKDWNEVDNALAEIGKCDREMTLLEAGANEHIDIIKSTLKKSVAPFAEKKASLELAIKDFCEVNRAEFAKVKTRELPFGSVGYRLSTKIMIKRVAETIQALKDMQLVFCVRTKEEPDKEAMKGLTDEILAEVGASRKTENVFGYEVNQERLKEVA